MTDRNDFEYALIAFGGWGATRLVRLEGQPTEFTFLIRPVNKTGQPTTKHAREVQSADLLVRFPGWPTTNQLQDAKYRLRNRRDAGL